MNKSLYDKLGVKKNASKNEIKYAFKKKAKDNHPDKTGGDNKEMMEINHAYFILKDDIKRDRYDTTGLESEVPFENKFIVLVNSIFIKIAEMEEVDYTDLVDVFKQQCELQNSQFKLKRDEEQAKMNMFKKVIRRLEKSKDGRIANVVLGHIDVCKRNMAILEAEMEFIDKAILVISDHEYTFDPKPPEPKPVEVSWNFNNFR